ncbi:MAG: HPF/RaiA family ribosome-associated protein [Bdellovibrionaceae bacterium]|nr:HPF/RaiA family ribosome-associated protein [Bdellovibrio sp.]
MMIQVHTGQGINGTQDLHDRLIGMLEADLGHFAEHLTRVDIHLHDLNSSKRGGIEKRCQIEAHVARMGAVSVHSDDETVSQAFEGAAEKLKHLLDHKIGEARSHRHQKPVIDLLSTNDFDPNDTVVS